MTLDGSALLDLAESTAKAAGRVLLDARAGGSRLRDLGNAAVRKSSATDLATDADRASEALVRERILATRPHDTILGEEGGSVTGSSGITWIVDPLDGTTNFVYDFPSWSVSIAATDADGALVGVVHNPLHDETWRAWRGHGAWLGSTELDSIPAPPLSEALVGTGFSYGSARRYDQGRLLPTVLAHVRDIRRAGSAALDLCSVAAGRLDAFYESDLKPWDTAAGVLIAQEAGCATSVIDLAVRGGQPGPPTLVIARQPLLDELTELLRNAAAQAGTTNI